MKCESPSGSNLLIYKCGENAEDMSENGFRQSYEPWVILNMNGVVHVKHTHAHINTHTP